MIITQKLSMKITNRTWLTWPVGYLMYKYHGVFETFNFKHYVLVCSFSKQMNGEENFKHSPFITEAWNLGDLIFVEHADN